MNDDITIIADGAQKITLRRPGSDFETEISRTLFRPYRHQRPYAVHESVIPTRFAHWYLPQESLPESPREGDEIIDFDGTRWLVVEIHSSPLNGTVQCIARSYSVTFGLDEYVDHLKTAYEKTAAGVLDRGFRTVKTGVAAKFSKKTVEPDEVRKETFFVLIRERIEFESLDCLRRADGTVVEIEKINEPLFPNDWIEISCTSKS